MLICLNQNCIWIIEIEINPDRTVTHIFDHKTACLSSHQGVIRLRITSGVTSCLLWRSIPWDGESSLCGNASWRRTGRKRPSAHLPNRSGATAPLMILSRGREGNATQNTGQGSRPKGAIWINDGGIRTGKKQEAFTSSEEYHTRGLSQNPNIQNWASMKKYRTLSCWMSL